MDTAIKHQVIDADAHVVETDRTWDYLDPADEKYRPKLEVDPNDSGNSPRTTMSLATGITFNSIPTSGSEIQFHAKGYARSGIIVLENAEGETNSIVVVPSGKVRVQ